jgi:hypothetical protein
LVVLGGLLAAAALLLGGSGHDAQASSVTPVVLEGASNDGKRCSDHQGSETWTEFKLEGADLSNGSHTDGILTVTISDLTEDLFDWMSNIGVDAVIVKGGNAGSYLYLYDPESTEDQDLGVPGPNNNAISHISFCYDVEPPELTVIKHVVNDNGGTTVASDFTMEVTGTNVSPSSFPGAEDPGTSVSLDAGAYSVSESGPSGYQATYSADCVGSIGLGESKTCTITNDDQPGSITVVKQVVGPAPATDWSFGGSLGTFTLAAGGGQQTFSDLDAGQYTISETTKDGYTASVSCTGGEAGSDSVTVDLSQDESIICTFINTLQVTPTPTPTPTLTPTPPVTPVVLPTVAPPSPTAVPVIETPPPPSPTAAPVTLPLTGGSGATPSTTVWPALALLAGAIALMLAGMGTGMRALSRRNR